MFEPRSKFKPNPWLVTFVLFAVVAALYYPGLNGPYVLDDIPSLMQNSWLDLKDLRPTSIWEAAVSYPTGPLYRPIPMASFALNFYFFGNDGPYSLKLVNVFIHLLTAWGVFLLTRRLLMHAQRTHCADNGLATQNNRVLWVALFITALWALHPLHVSTVLYAVQRMAELAALFCVYSIVVYFKGREQLLRGQVSGIWWILGALGIGGGLAVFSKENGALLPVLLLVIEVVFFRFKFHRAINSRIRWLLVAMLALPTLAIIGYLLSIAIGTPQGSPTRSFTLLERLLTEARALFFYLRLILLPDITAMSLYHDDFGTSVSLFNPATTFLSVAGLGGLLMFTAYGLWRNKFRVLCFGILWFLAGHLLESTVIQLLLLFEHRNYLPSYGPLFAAGYYLTRAGSHAVRIRPAIRILLAAALIIFLADGLYQRTWQWSSLSTLAVHEVANHPNSPGALNHLSSVYGAHGHFQQAEYYARKAAALDPEEPGYAMVILFFSLLSGKDLDAELIAEIEQRLSTKPINAYTINQLANLLRLGLNNPANHDWLSRLLRATLANERLLNPGSRADAHYFLGVIALRGERFTNAVDELEAALAAFPGNPETPKIRLALAHGLAGMNRLAEARHEMEAARNSLTPKQLTELGLLEKMVVEKENPRDSPP